MNPEVLAEVVRSVQNRLGILFDPMEVFEVTKTTVRKVEVKNLGESYIPLLFEDELHDLAVRNEINKGWRNEKCVMFV